MNGLRVIYGAQEASTVAKEYSAIIGKLYDAYTVTYKALNTLVDGMTEEDIIACTGLCPEQVNHILDVAHNPQNYGADPL
jgi:hypothetical protein